MPGAVRLSRRLLAASYLLSVLAAIGCGRPGAAGAYIVLALSLPFLIWVCHAIGKRRKWPRILMVASSVLNGPILLAGLDQLLGDWPGILTAGAGVLLITATSLLFHPRASAWFR